LRGEVDGAGHMAFFIVLWAESHGARRESWVVDGGIHMRVEVCVGVDCGCTAIKPEHVDAEMGRGNRRRNMGSFSFLSCL